MKRVKLNSLFYSSKLHPSHLHTKTFKAATARVFTSSAQANHCHQDPLCQKQNFEKKIANFTQNHPIWYYVFDKIIIAIIVAWLLNQLNEYQQAKKEMKKIGGELRSLIQQLGISHVQPGLYWTTVVSAEDKKNHEDTNAFIGKQQVKLDQLIATLSGIGGIFHLPIEMLTEIAVLKKQAERHKQELTLIQHFNQSVWLHKQRQYETALRLITDTILPKTISLKKESTIADKLLDADLFLPVVYNAKAKLEACLARTKSADKKRYRQKALASYNRAIKIYEDMPAEKQPKGELAVLYNSKAFLLTDSGYPEDALSEYKKALELLPQNAGILSGIGRALYRIERGKNEQERDKQKLDEAYGYLTKAIQVSKGKEANHYLYRAQLLMLIGQLKAADEDIGSALKLNTYHFKAQFEKARLLLKCGKCQQAEEFLAQCLAAWVEKPEKQADYLAKYNQAAKTAGCPPFEDKARFLKI